MKGHLSPRGIAALALFAGACLATASAVGGEAPATPPIRVGLVSSLFHDLPEPIVQAVMRPFRALMEQQTGLSGEFVMAGEADNLGRLLTDGKAQLGILHGFEFAWVRQKYPTLQPLMIIVNQQTNPQAMLVVREDSGVAAVSQLRGKVVAVPRRTKEHCRLFLERRCRDCSRRSMNEFFGGIVRPADVDDALQAVIDGTSQAALVDSVALATFQRQKPAEFAKVKIAQVSEMFPAAVVVYNHGSIDDPLLQRFHQGMVKANQTAKGRQLLSLCLVTGFADVPADYEQTLTAILKAYPSPSSGK
jgi:ABC-type phosphate/phosphonate transport system substrate-binding protein